MQVTVFLMCENAFSALCSGDIYPGARQGCRSAQPRGPPRAHLAESLCLPSAEQAAGMGAGLQGKCPQDGGFGVHRPAGRCVGFPAQGTAGRRHTGVGRDSTAPLFWGPRAVLMHADGCRRLQGRGWGEGTAHVAGAVQQMESETELGGPGQLEPTPCGLCPQLSRALQRPRSRRGLLAPVSGRSVLGRGDASPRHVPVLDHTAPSTAREKILGVSAAQRRFP